MTKLLSIKVTILISMSPGRPNLQMIHESWHTWMTLSLQSVHGRCSLAWNRGAAATLPLCLCRWNSSPPGKKSYLTPLIWCSQQIGEVGQQFSGKNPASTERAELPPSLQDVVQLGGGDEESASKNEGEGWSITFEQFYASILTEPSLVDNFSQRTDIEVNDWLFALNQLAPSGLFERL